MGWTLDWTAANQNWHQLANINDFLRATQERAKTLNNGVGHVAFVDKSAGDNVQTYTLWRSIQWWADHEYSHFAVCADNGVMRGAGHYDGAGSIDAYADLTALFSAAGLAPQTNWRRYTTHPDAGGADLSGRMVAGDIIGPWIFEDLQAVLNVMVWTRHNCNWVSGGLLSRDDGRAEEEVSWAVAVAVAQADYGSPFGGDQKPYSITYGGYTVADDYSAVCDRAQAYASVIGGDTVWAGINRDAEWYIKAQTPTAGVYNWTFHAQGETVVDGVWKLWLTDAPAAPVSEPLVSSAVMAPVATRPAPFPAEPMVDEFLGLGWTCLPGVMYNSNVVVVRWNVVDGFTYH